MKGRKAKNCRKSVAKKISLSTNHRAKTLENARMLQGLERLAFYRLFDNISMKSNNLSLIRNIWVEAMEGHNLITSKSTAILTATISNTASHFEGRNDFTGGGGKSFHWGGQLPPQTDI